jgi:phage terminase large subunit-like protein
VDDRRSGSVGVRNAAKGVQDASAPPWKAWRIRTRHGRAIKFIETYCAPPKGRGHGKPLKLARFQKEYLEEALADGIDATVLTTPRGNGKSTFGGAIATWALYDDDATGAPQVPIVATTIGQAIKSCYGVAASMIRAHPDLVNRSLIYTGIATPRVVFPFNEGELFPISNDPDGLQGLDYSFALFDEIGFQPLDSWDSLRLASGKRERSLVMGVGTRGFDRENALHHLLSVIHDGAQIEGFYLREYSAPLELPVDDPATWRIANPAMVAKFLRQSALANDLGITTEGRFRIFRLNQEWEGVESWLGEDGRKQWDALQDPYEFISGAPTWVGVDVGLKRDSTAVVTVQRRPDGHLHAKCRVWFPRTDEAVDVTDVMQHIRELAATYDLQAVSYDPRFFDVPAKMLFDSGIIMVEIPQSVERMTPACGNLLEIIKRAELRHDGDDAFATQVLNAVPRFNERGFTLQKSKSRGRIDACIALALAVERAAQPAAAVEFIAV